MRRRDAIIRLGFGAAGASLFPHCALAAPGLKLGDIADLALRLRRAPHERAFDVATAAIRAGADHRVLLGAVFLAGIHDIRPQPVGGRLHCVMMVESAFDLATRLSRKQAFLAALWNLDYFKRSQTRDRESGDWVLPARPDVTFADEPTARREFVAAMEAWDIPQADRALVGLLPFHDRRSVFEILWPYSARCLESLGHKIVFGSQVERVLRRIEWRHAEPVLRALVHGLLSFDDEPQVEVYRNSTALAATLRDGWEAGEPDIAGSRRLASALRGWTPLEAQKRVAALLNDGLAPASVWDGLRLFASELFLRRLSSDPETGEAVRAVHPVTELHAFGHAWRTTEIPATRRLLLLQAAGWVAALRDGLVQRKAISMDGPGIDTLGSGSLQEQVGINDLLKTASPARARVRLEGDAEAAKTYLARLRDGLIVNAVESHQYKYAAALEEEVAQTHPGLRAQILAPAIPYLPASTESRTAFLAPALRALAAAGVT